MKKETMIKYIKTDLIVCFDQIEDKECFYSGCSLYMKILQQDLEIYEINNINAISILNAGLTFFESDEKVTKVIREKITK